MSTSAALFDPLRLPSGVVVPNRVAKAAMEESMADAQHAPGAELQRLYRAWADGGSGLIITGNVMIDSRALTGPRGVVLEDDAHLDRFARWAEASRAQGALALMQINHPGRQVYAAMGQPAIAPSAIALDIPGFSKFFAQPQAMSEAQIHEQIARFAHTARLAERAGFSGVEIHAAHGYLLSQFLSPLSNHRDDDWGGSLANRARFLLEVVRQVRAVVSADFCVAVKLNSADFQRGGFEASDALHVIEMLNELRVDLIEISGGSYESPAMNGTARDGRTLAREAYFLEFAKDIVKVARMPVMVTGGIRRREVAETVLAGGIAIAGIATALSCAPQLPCQWRDGQNLDIEVPRVGWKNKALAATASMAVIKTQLQRIGEGRAPKPGVSPFLALLRSQLKTRAESKRYRQWLADRAATPPPTGSEPLSA